ncbi:MAG: hypothetical protein KKC79_07425 [Gammaproteobacteria bacterium]|nr:hypothetical protein [Gammaproteobacteria bacterium]MBU1440521.1 hypothetical protein [Gammaproteobacteria bacterium]MBU2288722.1 hypothetical protein [Gammaproteobacteria bacterium]MBU2408466.1 hypothetical protein [Gammaproteobacteria bacterium]
MSDGDRAKQVTSPGGGGDSISYYPYRDLEKAIREALRSVYQEVSTVQSPTDARAAPGSEIDLIFVPTIKTTSHSPSALTWPPTEFNTEITCSVQDASGQEIATIKAIGQGRAEFEEFRSNFSLAANRAANDVSAKLSEAIRQQDKLR